MHDFPSLEALGPRICILGPSNAGKSTLTVAIADKLDLPPIHLDLLYHKPYTNWEPRPREEFVAAHAEAVAGERWVMEGNYVGLLDTRLAHATGIILLGTDRWSAFARYLRRTLFQRGRIGALPGAQDSLKWLMIKYILLEQPKKRQRDIALLRASGLPMVKFDSLGELRRAYEAWGLSRPTHSPIRTVG
jgi:adenylate kinase family enzyme